MPYYGHSRHDYNAGPVERARVISGMKTGLVVGAVATGGALTVSHFIKGGLMHGVSTISRHKTPWEVAGVMVGMTLLGGAIGAWIGATSAPPKKKRSNHDSFPTRIPVPLGIDATLVAAAQTNAPGTHQQFTSIADAINAATAATTRPMPYVTRGPGHG